MRVLVTGGAGFIGSHIAHRLVADHEVVVLDDLSTGRREAVPARAEFVELDIRDAVGVERVVASHRPHAICHQAAQSSVVVSTRDPARDAQINVIGTINLLVAAREHGVEKFVHASTGGALYGEVPDGKRARYGWPTRPLSPYGCSKLASESYVRAFAETRSLAVNILRYSNVYGPGQNPHGEAGVVAIFCGRLLAGESVVVFARSRPGDEGCVRDYVLVDDVVRANLAALDGSITVETLDVGTGEGTATRAVLDTLAARLGVEVQVEGRPPRPGDLQRSVLDPTQARRQLGELTGLPDGLRTTAAWFREHSALG